MTMAYIAGNRSDVLPIGRRLAEIATGLSEAYAAWRVYRQTVTELQNLSSRELADLGLTRGMIRQVALDAAYGKVR